MLGKARLRADEIGHHVERIAHDDDDGFRRVLLHVIGHAADDLGVLHQQVVAAHAGLAGQAARDDDDIRTGVIGGIVRALHIAVEIFQAGRLQHVERLALRHALDDVVQDDIAQFFFRQTLGRGGPDKTSSDNGDFHKWMSLKWMFLIEKSTKIRKRKWQRQSPFPATFFPLKPGRAKENSKKKCETFAPFCRHIPPTTMKLTLLTPALVAVLGFALASAPVTVQAQTTNAAPLRLLRPRKRQSHNTPSMPARSARLTPPR